MRPLIFITLLGLTCSCYGQDTLRADTDVKVFAPIAVENSLADPTGVAAKKHSVKRKKSQRQILKLKSAPDTVLLKKKVEESAISRNENKGFSYLWLLVFAVIVGLLLRPVSYNNSRQNKASVNGENQVSDHVARTILPRREYYRNVYLKSDAWQRKRYLVFKRDNWRCVYCGGKATQVHHLRYAKRNIGKEPIEWLVSICDPCHKAQH